MQVSPAVRKILHFVGSNLKLDGLPNLTGLSFSWIDRNGCPVAFRLDSTSWRSRGSINRFVELIENVLKTAKNESAPMVIVHLYSDVHFAKTLSVQLYEL